MESPLRASGRAPVLQIPKPAAGESPLGASGRESPLARFNHRYFDKFTSAQLAACRDELLSVLDERGRQCGLFEDQPGPVAVPAPPPAPRPAADVAARLSPSQLNTFVGDCQVKWFYRNVLKLADPKDANRALGSAVHEALTENFRQKLETREDLDVAGVCAIFRYHLEEQLAGAQLASDDKPEDLRDLGEALVALYMERVAPTVDPAAVELPVEGVIGGVHVSGYIDVLDTAGNVIDLKTAAKKPSGVRPEYRRQLTTYVMLAPEASGRGRLDTMTKTRTVALHQQSYDVVGSDRREVERLYPLAQEAMRGGLYLPNRGSYLCSRRYCPFADRCVAEYGGEVD